MSYAAAPGAALPPGWPDWMPCFDAYWMLFRRPDGTTFWRSWAVMVPCDGNQWALGASQRFTAALYRFPLDNGVVSFAVNPTWLFNIPSASNPVVNLYWNADRRWQTNDELRIPTTSRDLWHPWQPDGAGEGFLVP